MFGRQEDKTGLPEDTEDIGHILLDDEVGEDSWFCPSHKSTTLAMTRSSVRVDRSIRRAMMDLLRSEAPYDAIIASLENEGNQEVIKGLYKYRLRGRQLYAHRTEDTEAVEAEDYWKMVVPNNQDIKQKILHELHSVPYAGHPGYVRTLRQVHRYFYWKGLATDVRSYIEECPVC